MAPRLPRLRARGAAPSAPTTALGWRRPIAIAALLLVASAGLYGHQIRPRSTAPPTTQNNNDPSTDCLDSAFPSPKIVTTRDAFYIDRRSDILLHHWARPKSYMRKFMATTFTTHLRYAAAKKYSVLIDSQQPPAPPAHVDGLCRESWNAKSGRAFSVMRALNATAPHVRPSFRWLLSMDTDFVVNRTDRSLPWFMGDDEASAKVSEFTEAYFLTSSGQ